jgi:hypothetical protein
MPHPVIDPSALLQRTVYLLQHGLRTATYKLATLSALVEFSVDNPPPRPEDELPVPIHELACRVMALYWPHLSPFDGRILKQSTQTRSRIFDSLIALRYARVSADEAIPLDVASARAPAIYRRAVDNIGVCLAQQPLPRLQRLAGSSKSESFLYDDSFLHDNVSRTELRAHGNAIRLNPGVATGFAAIRTKLLPTLRTMWCEDVVRMNRLPDHRRSEVEEHLFGAVDSVATPDDSHIGFTPPPLPAPAGRHRAPPGDAHFEGDASPISAEERSGRTIPDIQTFAERLNALFDTHLRADGSAYTPHDVATALQEEGLAVSEGLIVRLGSGASALPTLQTIDALAYFFNVSSDYFWAGAHSAQVREILASVRTEDSRSAREVVDDEVVAVPAPEDIGMSASELGRIVSVLADAAGTCLSRVPAESEQSGRLLRLLSEIGSLLSAPADGGIRAPRSLLRRIILEGTAAETASAYRDVFLHVADLLGDTADE